MAEKCLVCSNEAVAIQRLFRNKGLDKAMLCKTHDRELFLLGERRFSERYYLTLTKREHIQNTIQGFGSVGGF
jgi:hypothetical protein